MKIKRSVRTTAKRFGLFATATGVLLASLAVGAPANAAVDIVTPPGAPTYESVARTPENTAEVRNTTQFNAAYANAHISHIVLTAEVTYSSSAPFTGAQTVLNRSLSIDGNGHRLTFGSGAAGGNRPFYLKNQSDSVSKLSLELRNVNIRYGYDSYLVSGEYEQARGWNIVLDDVNLNGISGFGVGSPAGRPVSAYLADVFLSGTGDATNTYGRLFPRTLVVEEGANWRLAPTAYASNEPQLDMSYGLAYGGKDGGKVWVQGNLNVDGGALSAIWSFAGIYVGSNGSLTATNNYNGYSYGALTTAGGTSGTGQLWVDNGGSLSVTNEAGIAIYAIAGAPLDLRTDPGAKITITGTSAASWIPSYGLGTITIATNGSTLQFNEPAVLDIKNLGDTATNNWAISTYAQNGAAFGYNLSILDSFQVATWNRSTSNAASPDFSYDNATLVTNAAGKAQAGSAPAKLATQWTTGAYRRIFAGNADVSSLPIIDPTVGMSALLGATVIAGAGGIPLMVRRRREAAATPAV